MSLYTKLAAFIASASVRPCLTPSFNVCPANAAPSIRLAVAPADTVEIPAVIKPLATNGSAYLVIPIDLEPLAIAAAALVNLRPLVAIPANLAAPVAGIINDKANGSIRATPVPQKSISDKSSQVTFSKSANPGTSSP